MFAIILPLAFLMMIGFCVIMYVILDGFTLGTGIILPWLNTHERNIAVSMILPTWDGNQTWLVLGMATLYGSFPLAFSVLLPILYLPLLVMVVALLLRGVVFEFRLKAKDGIIWWDRVFFLSSLLVTFTQGIILGNVVEGFKNPHWLTPFSVFAALSLVFGYTLLGLTRIIIKTTGTIQEKAYRYAWICGALVVLALIIVSVWTPFVDPFVKARWFNPKLMPYLAILPAITGFAVLGLIFSLYKKFEYAPYWLSVILFLCPYAGFAISIFPFIVPYHITLWQAASPTNTLMFLLVGAGIMLPVLMIYTFYSYHIFRGKVRDVIEY